MGWAKFDDQFTDHPKVVAAGPMAELLAMRAVIYCARHETDGLIRESVLPRLTVGISSPKKQVSALIREGLWEKTDDGWVVHDFLDYHPSKADKEAERQAARERMRDVRANKKRTKAERSGEQPVNNGRSSPYPDPTPPEPDQETPSPNPSMLPAERWSRYWCELMGLPQTRAVLKFMIPKAQDYIAAAGEPTEGLLKRAKAAGIRTPGGWGFISNPQREEVPDWLENHWRNNDT